MPSAAASESASSAEVSTSAAAFKESFAASFATAAHERSRGSNIPQMCMTDCSDTVLMDLFLAVHCLWNRPDHLPVIREIIARTIREHGYSIALPLGQFMREIEAFEQEVEEEITVAITEEYLESMYRCVSSI